MFTKTNKNDPLVESIKNVMEHNDFLRRVETAVNEHFGVTSKKALPHERHAEYDALFEETKRCAMEEEKKDDDNKSSPATPEHHRAEAIRIHKQIKSGGKMPHLVAKKKEHEDAYKRMTGRKIDYPKDLDEAVGPEKYSHDQKKFAMLGNVSGHGGNPKKIDKQDLKAARGGHAHKVGLEEKATEAQKEKVAKVMHKWKQGKEHIGKSEKTVPVTKKGQKQAVAIALSQAGLSKKDKMNEETSIDSILEEIRTNLEEQLVSVFESGDETAFAEYVSSLTEEQLEILGLMEADKKGSSTPGIPTYGDAVLSKTAAVGGGTTPMVGSMAAQVRKSTSTGRSAGDTSASSRVGTFNSDKAQVKHQQGTFSGGTAGTASPGGGIKADAGRLSGVIKGPGYNPIPQNVKKAGQEVTSTSGATTYQSPKAVAIANKGPTAAEKATAAAVKRDTTGTATKIQPVSTQTNAARRPGTPATGATNPAARPAARPGMTQRPTAQRRVPGAAAAAAQKRIGYQTRAASATPGSMMAREETEAPKPIKESFEQFLRNKFLKG